MPVSDFTYLFVNFDTRGDVGTPEDRYVCSQPLKISVYADTSKETEAEIITFTDLTQFGNTLQSTTDTSTRRSVKITSLALEVPPMIYNSGGGSKLYRWYKREWCLVAIYGTTDNTAEILQIGDLRYYQGVDDVYDISDNEKFDSSKISPYNGTYQWVFTFYNADLGIESAPSAPSKETDIYGERATLSMYLVNPGEPFDTQITHVRLYRIGGNHAKFTMVEEIRVHNNGSNKVKYMDTLVDKDMDGRILEANNYYEAPTGLQFLSESYAMLFGAIGTALLFTPVNLPNAWPPEYSIEFESDITAIGQVSNGIIVCTRYKTYLVAGTGPYSLVQQLLRGDQGCIAFESMQEAYKGALIWASEDGLCTSSGNNVVSITKGFVNNIALEPTSSVVHNEIYYCHNKDGKTLVWDYRFAPTLCWLDLGVKGLTKGKNKIYGYLEGFLYSLYEGADNLTLQYKSPLFIEGSFTNQKTYKKVYIRSDGDIILNILIDNIQVATFSLTGIKTHQVQVPQNLQRGYSIQFEIRGTGTVNEIEYVTSPRQDG